jgi:energy-coupling factor transport system permease protein
MSDVRLRVITLLILSVSVFFVPQTAVFGFIWWLIFSKQSLRVMAREILAAVLISAFPTLILLISSDVSALIYGGKTAVLLLLAFWFGKNCVPGDFQNLFVWLFGNRIGFDLGLACEIFMMQMSFVFRDAKGYRAALSQKNKRLGPLTILPLAFGVLALSIRRMKLSSKLLARRGYVKGGTCKPVFYTEKADVLRLVLAAGIFMFGIIL